MDSESLRTVFRHIEKRNLPTTIPAHLFFVRDVADLSFEYLWCTHLRSRFLFEMRWRVKISSVHVEVKNMLILLLAREANRPKRLHITQGRPSESQTKRVFS